MKRIFVGLALVMAALLSANCCIRPMCSVDMSAVEQPVEQPGQPSMLK